jgi:hypothetical protein
MPLPDYAGIRRAASRAEAGATAALHTYSQGRVPDEPRLVERTLTNIEHELNGLTSSGMTWVASSLTSTGRRSAESQSGADFVGVFDVRLPDYVVTKGFSRRPNWLRPETWVRPSARG